MSEINHALKPAPFLWDPQEGGDLSSRLSAWLQALITALDGDPDLSTGFAALDIDGRNVASLPAGRLRAEASHRAVSEAQRLGRLVFAGALPGSPDQSARTTVVVPLSSIRVQRVLLILEITIQAEEAVPRLLALLSLASGWPHATLLEHHIEEEEAGETAALASLQAVVAFSGAKRFSEAARALMTDLATRYNCDRVALGLARRRRVRIAAISNTGLFSRSQGLARKIKAAMEEAFDQERLLLWPVPEENSTDMIVERQMELAEGDETRSILTIPLFDQERYKGAVLFERTDGLRFTERELSRLEALCSILTPLIIEKRENDRWLPMRLVMASANFLGLAFGRSYLVAKLLILIMALAIGALFVVQTNRSVVAEAIVQGVDVRTLSTPFSGFIAEAPRREGDRITEGELLLRLDDRELLLELTRLSALRAQTELERDEAISERDRAEVGLITSRLRQIDAQIELINQQIARSRLNAPFDGVVISGDMSSAIGRSVERGEPLLVIAPLAEYRIDMFVPEDAVDLVQPGQNAILKVTPLPERSFPLMVEGTMPVARYENGQTRYQVTGVLDTPPDVLVPGMRGAVRIEIDRASLAQVWFMPLIDRVRVWLWKTLAI